jgi:hypothetical protein
MKSRNSSLNKRYDHSYNTKDRGGLRKSFIDFGKEENVKYYKAKEGTNRIVIVPYKIKINTHPMVAAGKMEKGDIDYLMDIHIHRNVGAANSEVVCLKMDYNKKCPLCMQAMEYKDKGMKKEYDALKATRRVVYNVIDADDPQKGIQIFNVSHYLFEEPLISESRAYGEHIDFADPEDGKIIKFRGVKVKKNNQEYLEYESFRFEERDRDTKVTDEMIDEAHSFDEYITIHTADELERILYGEDEPEAKEENNDRSERRNERKDEDERTEKEEKREDRKKESSKKENDCPHGHEFGTDCDKTDDCKKCVKWEDCDEAAYTNKKKGK